MTQNINASKYKCLKCLINYLKDELVIIKEDPEIASLLQDDLDSKDAFKVNNNN